MARPIATHDNSKVMDYLKGKSYNRRTPKMIRSIIDSVTSKEAFKNGKGGNSLYVFEALKRVPTLTNIEVGKCVNAFRLEMLFNNHVGSMTNEEAMYVRNHMYDDDGFVNVAFLELYSSDFREFKLLEISSIKNYGKAAREASVMLEKKIKVPALDESIKQLLDSLIASGVDQKIIMDYLKKKK